MCDCCKCNTDANITTFCGGDGKVQFSLCDQCIETWMQIIRDKQNVV